MAARYQCRRCSAACDPSFAEVNFGRVVCAFCGGTCDPTPKEQRLINTAMQVGKADLLRKAYLAAGWGTNQFVGRGD